MAMSTKVEQVDSKEYIKSVIKVNLSTIIIMSWFMISGLLSSYYCVVSASQLVDAIFVKNINLRPDELPPVPWHNFIWKKDEKSKPETVEQEVIFNFDQVIHNLENIFLNKLRGKINSFETDNRREKKYHNIAFIELLSIIKNSIEWDCWVITESFEFIHKIAPHGVVLMTSFIILPIFLAMFFILNLFYTIFAWFKSIYGAFTQCGIVDYFDTVLHKTTGNVDPQALSVIGSLFFLFFYAIILPALSFITIIPILIYFFITLCVIPVYSLFLPLMITGNLGFKNKHADVKTTPFTLGTSMFSNIYTYMNYYSVVFSIVYALVASILQDAYYFVGCLVAIILIWVATSFYKQEPFMGKSSSSTSSPDGEGGEEDDVASSSDDGNNVQLPIIADVVTKEELEEASKATIDSGAENTVSPGAKVDDTSNPLEKAETTIVPDAGNSVSPGAKVDDTSNPSEKAGEVESVIVPDEKNDAQMAELERRLAELKKGGGSNKKRNKSKNKRSSQ